MTLRSLRVPDGHDVGVVRFHCVIPLFAKNVAHSPVPLDDSVAAARSGGQERPQAGACALLLTGASTAACSLSAASFGMRSIPARWTVIGSISVLAASIFGLSAAQILSAPPITTAASQPSDPYAQYVAEASRRFGIPDRWIRAVMQVESGGDPHVVSKRGAIGLMQVMPPTWRELQDRYGLGANPDDPHDNIIAGTAYLREMYDRFGPDGFLAAYNAGPEQYVRSRDSGVPLPVETQRYIVKLGSLIDGSRSGPIAWDSAGAHPWQSSSLFVNTAAATFDTTRTAHVSLYTRPSRETAAVDLSALVPASRDLFVARPKGNKVP